MPILGTTLFTISLDHEFAPRETSHILIIIADKPITHIHWRVRAA